MKDIKGNWSGEITGTNNANVFLEIKQEKNNLKGITRINDPTNGVAIYSFTGVIDNNDLTLKMNLDPRTQLSQQGKHGTVTLHGTLVDEVTIEGTWSSTIGTGGYIVVKNTQKKRTSNIEEARKNRSQVFISYSHKDEQYLERLRIHLKPLEKEGIINVWDDTKIKVGDKWKEEILKALSESAIAILIISADFMNSDFITENELPIILEKAEKEGTRILPVILSPCRFLRDRHLSQFQSLNAPDNPVLEMPVIGQEAIWDKLSNVIEDELGT